MHVSIKKVSQFFWHASFAVIVCFDLIFDLFNLYYYYFFIADFKFEDDFSNSNSTIWLNRDIPKFKIWHDVNILHFIKFQFKYEHNRRHKNKKLLELKNIWNRNRIYFFHFILLIYNVGQYEHKNTLMFAFYSSYLKDCFFFVLSKNRHGAYLLNILKQATENSVQKELKNISPVFISLLIFGFPQNSYFHIIFTISVLAQIRRIIYWGKRMKGIQMNQFLYLSIQDCQTWMGICLEKLNVRTLIRICIICRINIVNQ